MKHFIPLAFLVFAAAMAHAAEPAAALKAVLDEAWEFELRENPFRGQEVDDHRFDDRLPQVAPADFERRTAFWKGMLERLTHIDRNALSEAERVSYDMFKRDAEDDVSRLEFRTW